MYGRTGKNPLQKIVALFDCFGVKMRHANKPFFYAVTAVLGDNYMEARAALRSAEPLFAPLRLPRACHCDAHLLPRLCVGVPLTRTTILLATCLCVVAVSCILPLVLCINDFGWRWSFLWGR